MSGEHTQPEPEADDQKPSTLTDDRFGFTVNPDEIRAIVARMEERMARKQKRGEG